MARLASLACRVEHSLELAPRRVAVEPFRLPALRPVSCASRTWSLIESTGCSCSMHRRIVSSSPPAGSRAVDAPEVGRTPRTPARTKGAAPHHLRNRLRSRSVLVPWHRSRTRALRAAQLGLYRLYLLSARSVESLHISCYDFGRARLGTIASHATRSSRSLPPECLARSNRLSSFFLSDPTFASGPFHGLLQSTRVMTRG